MVEDRVITGWVEVGGIAVLAEYDPGERWNGWLCRRLDPYAAVTVLSVSNISSPAHSAGRFTPTARH